MGVKLFAMTCGTLTGSLANLMEGGEGEVTLPVPAYLIERPVRVHDREAMHESLEKLARLQAGGARIFFGHDSEFWKTVPQAPAAIV